ncbi:ribonuclease Oy isoform X2 [Periplaneta americana]|uniref:ribonuclease Oy isoform X2 n=1 Tax=Periplaneta americana TaxID=6978 RepID=UPI0037E900EB
MNWIITYMLSTLFLLICIDNFNIPSVDAKQSKEWDVLIFTQHWPLTVCLQWKEVVPQHTCSLPTIKNTWTVHGIWPTKLGTKGPQFCNSSMHFNKTELEPIEKQLELYWTNIHNGSIYSLWKHEWKKHGTCAAVLPALGTERKYFGQGLEWINQYDMSNILSKSGIEPKNQSYTPQNIWDAVYKTLGKIPAVQCIVDPKTKDVYLFEIRICFDKNLTLTDCDGIKESAIPAIGIKTNCPLNKTIIYPSALPTFHEKPFYTISMPVFRQHSWLFEALRIIQFLQWFTF